MTLSQVRELRGLIAGHAAAPSPEDHAATATDLRDFLLAHVNDLLAAAEAETGAGVLDEPPLVHLERPVLVQEGGARSGWWAGPGRSLADAIHGAWPLDASEVGPRLAASSADPRPVRVLGFAQAEPLIEKAAEEHYGWMCRGREAWWRLQRLRLVLEGLVA